MIFPCRSVVLPYVFALNALKLLCSVSLEDCTLHLTPVNNKRSNPCYELCEQYPLSDAMQLYLMWPKMGSLAGCGMLPLLIA